MENKYWEKSLEFQEEITSYISEILRVYGNELLLRIEELNLLSAKNNCISSSTAIGYCVEEFLVSKLETYTNSTPKTKFRIQRDNTSTQNKSYDCYSEQGNDLYLVNLKVNKKNNNAVAAIDRLYK
ncbi:MAG: UpaP162 family type II restriction enzyme, partial [Metamycoplasma salivarium]